MAFSTLREQIPALYSRLSQVATLTCNDAPDLKVAYVYYG